MSILISPTPQSRLRTLFLHSLSRDVLFPLSYRTLAFLVAGQRGTVTRVFCTCPQLEAGGKGNSVVVTGLCLWRVSLQDLCRTVITTAWSPALLIAPLSVFSVESLPCGEGLDLTSTQCHLGKTAWHTKKCLKLYVNMLLDSCWLSVCPLPVPYSPVPMGADPTIKLSLSHCPNLLHSPIQNQTQYCYHSPYWSLVTRPTGHWSLTLLVTSERLHAWLPAGLG